LTAGKGLRYIHDVNGLQNQCEWKYRSRWSAALLAERVEAFPVVVLSGMRQAGKSTLLARENPFSEFESFDLDDMETRRRFARDPGLPWASGERVIVDEVHQVPELLPALKSKVDRDPRFRALLSGSANLLLMRDVSESLAGRAAYLDLWSFAVGEWEEAPMPAILDRLLSGSLPGSADVPGRAPALEIARGLLPPARLHARPDVWWDAYVRTYLERDLRDLSSLSSLPDFRRFMEMMALRVGQVVNETELSSRLAVSQPTVHRWANVLETSHVLVRVPAYAVNRGKRLTKRPKCYLADPGLSAFLIGLYSADDVATSREYGVLFENLVLHHLRILASLLSPPARVFHWRTSDAKEVDFVVTHGRRSVAVECKATSRPQEAHARHLRLFRRLHPECAAGVVIHCGDRVEHLGEGIVAIPWTMLAGV
jgi:uncharacterized protein